MTARRIALIGVVGVLLLGTVGVPASARNQGNLGVLSPDNPRIVRDFLPMAGIFPIREGAVPFAMFRPPTCREVTYCDAFEIDVTYPDHYLREVFFGARFILTWDNPRTENNPNGNDLDFFLWPDDGEAAGGPSSKCGSPRAAECDNLPEEVISITEPADTEPEKTGDEDVDPLFFTVVNDNQAAGAPTGYTVEAEFFEFGVEFEEFGEFEIPEREPTTAGASTTPPPTADTGQGPSPFAGGNVSGPDDEPRKVLVPGPDGELVEMDLPVLAAGSELEPRNEGGVWNPITWSVIAAVLLGSGIAFLVLHRRRRAAEGDLY